MRNFLFFLFFKLFFFSFVFGLMTSSNYQILFDSVNIGGQDLSTSSNYSLKDTVGEIATGLSETSLYKLFAGYRQMDESFISLSLSSTTLSLLPDLGGVSGGVSNASTTATVVTDNLAGFSLTIKATSSPALTCSDSSCSADYFSDYTPSDPSIPDFNWSLADLSSEFGFTVEGSYLVQKFKDNGSVCNTGSLDTQDRCWYNSSTTEEYVSQSLQPSFPDGAQTILKFRAEIKPNRMQKPGLYQAVIVITAFAN
ncbi:MAG: hypothetical protein ACPLZH_01385 [Minisyncoccales bacterium]